MLPSPQSWRQLNKNSDAILELCNAVGHSGDMNPNQWALLMASVLEFQPDFILELGRGYGNSTCAFTTASHWLPQPAPVLSLCLTDVWQRETLSRLEPLLPADWFNLLDATCANILEYDFARALSGAKRVLIFWDAHGFDVAECVLGKILPLVAGNSHLVLMHDLCDARYTGSADYGGQRLWRGNNWDGPRLRVGNIDTAVEQTIAALDFTTRNGLKLHSVDEELDHWRQSDSQNAQALEQELGELFKLPVSMFYFTLNETPGPYTFPRFEPPLPQTVPRRSLGERLRRALRALRQ